MRHSTGSVPGRKDKEEKNNMGMVLANWPLCEGWVKGYWFILFSDPRVSLRNKMSTVLITGRTDGKKTQTVTTPVERQPTFQNKQTKKHRAISFQRCNPRCKVSCFFFSSLLWDRARLTHQINRSYVLLSTNCYSQFHVARWLDWPAVPPKKKKRKKKPTKWKN